MDNTIYQLISHNGVFLNCFYHDTQGERIYFFRFNVLSDYKIILNDSFSYNNGGAFCYLKPRFAYSLELGRKIWNYLVEKEGCKRDDIFLKDDVKHEIKKILGYNV